MVAHLDGASGSRVGSTIQTKKIGIDDSGYPNYQKNSRAKRYLSRFWNFWRKFCSRNTNGIKLSSCQEIQGALNIQTSYAVELIAMLKKIGMVSSEGRGPTTRYYLISDERE